MQLLGNYKLISATNFEDNQDCLKDIRDVIRELQKELFVASVQNRKYKERNERNMSIKNTKYDTCKCRLHFS